MALYLSLPSSGLGARKPADDEMIFIAGYTATSLSNFYDLNALWQKYNDENTQTLWDEWLEQAENWTVSYEAVKYSGCHKSVPNE